MARSKTLGQTKPAMYWPDDTSASAVPMPLRGEAQYAAFLERSKETHPLGRPGQADEVAELILFLASRQADWITGEVLRSRGGM